MGSRRPILRFGEMGIPPGSELRCTNNDVTVTVLDDRKVRFGTEVVYLTEATRRALGRGREFRSGPTGFWLFEEEPLWKIYNRTYGPRG